MDSDVFLIQGRREDGKQAARSDRLQRLWRSPGQLVGTNDGAGGNYGHRCVNGGILLLEPNKSVADLMIPLADMQRRREAKGHDTTTMIDPGHYSHGHPFARCPFGHDQPVLNAVIGHHWKDFLEQVLNTSERELVSVGPFMRETCDNSSKSAARPFYWNHTFYHAWLHTTPLGSGQKCSREALATSGCELPSIEDGHCKEVHNEYARDWWRTFERTLTRTQQNECLVHAYAE